MKFTSVNSHTCEYTLVEPISVIISVNAVHVMKGRNQSHIIVLLFEIYSNAMNVMSYESTKERNNKKTTHLVYKLILRLNIECSSLI